MAAPRRTASTKSADTDTAVKSRRSVAKTSGKPNGRSRQTAAAPPDAVPTHEQIALKAYQIWEARGRPTGMDAQNWSDAEASLRAAPGT